MSSSLPPINCQALIQKFPPKLQQQLQQHQIGPEDPKQLFDFVDFKRHRPEHSIFSFQEKKEVFSAVSEFIRRNAFKPGFLDCVPANLLVELIKKTKLANIQYDIQNKLRFSRVLDRRTTSPDDEELIRNKYILPEEQPTWPVAIVNHQEPLLEYIKQLIVREEYTALRELLENPKILTDKLIGRKIMLQIQTHVPSDIQLQWSKLLRISKDNNEPAGSRNHLQKMLGGKIVNRPVKVTDRPLDDYIARLGISQADLEQLDQGKLLLVGGGNSPVRSGLETARCHAQVVNIDPLFPELYERNEHIKLDKSFFDPQIMRFLNKNKFDEIWALHSLPTYANNPSEVVEFYRRALSALKEGGTLRVYPCEDFGDSLDYSMDLSRKSVYETSQQIIEALGKSNLFDIETYIFNQATFLKKDNPVKGIKIKIKVPAKQIEHFFKNLNLPGVSHSPIQPDSAPLFQWFLKGAVAKNIK